MPDLLIELFSEEIPARMQRKAAGDLKKLLTDKLVDAGLTYEAAREYWTPRRLTLDLRGLTAKSRDVHEERKGPSVKAPEAAIAGFLRAAGLDDISKAEIASDPKKGDYYVAKIVKPGRHAEDIIAEVMPDIIRNFPWPKSMRWGKASSEAGALKWVRPLHSIICVFGPETEETEVIDFEVGGIRSGRITYGHRFMSDGAPITVRRFEDYITKLEDAKVVLDAERRKEIILADARNLTFAKGLELVEDEHLAEEVAGLVEWPVVLLGEFEKEFLVIPPEIIRLTIRTNQKCFVTRNRGEEDALSNHFVLVSNIEAKDSGKEVTKGNGRVVRARLSDALYFWETDQAPLPDADKLGAAGKKFDLDLAKPLDQRMARLDLLDVTFHAKLGTQGARVARIAELSQDIATLIGADQALAKRAATLAKADLQTEVVGEFPELQGVMGHKYALLQGEAPNVAAAIEEHYKPQGPTDRVPRDPVSVAVALADKIDTLVGFWLIDEKPTGSKDPYALRRAALGVIRLALSREWQIRLTPLFKKAMALYAGSANQPIAQNNEALQDLLSFFHERLKVYLKDEGARHDAIDAILNADADDLLQIARRVEALIAFINTDDGENLLAGTKRAVNIYEAEVKKKTAIADKVDPALFTGPQETVLFEAIIKVEQEAARFIGEGNFSGALSALASLRAPIDAFFEDVLVNDEDQAVRANRLVLLQRIRAATSKVADFSKLAI